MCGVEKKKKKERRQAVNNRHTRAKHITRRIEKTCDGYIRSSQGGVRDERNPK